MRFQFDVILAFHRRARTHNVSAFDFCVLGCGALLFVSYCRDLIGAGAGAS